MINNDSVDNKKSIIRQVFGLYILKVIAEVCSLDSLNYDFDYNQIVYIDSCNGIIRVYFETQGTWMLTPKAFKNLRPRAEAIVKEDKTIEFHTQSRLTNEIA